MEGMSRLDSACPRSLRSAAALGPVAALAVGWTAADACNSGPKSNVSSSPAAAKASRPDA